MKFDLFPDNKYPAYGIFGTASASDCRICVLSSSHNCVVFLDLKGTILENFCLWSTAVSYLNVYHKEFRQITCFS